MRQATFARDGHNRGVRLAKPVSMKATVEAVRDARQVAERALPVNADPAVLGAVIAVVLREFLDNEYVNDLEPEGDDRLPRPAGQ